MKFYGVMKRMNDRNFKLAPYFGKNMFGKKLDDSYLTIIKYGTK